jgi:hypothetical protein
MRYVKFQIYRETSASAGALSLFHIIKIEDDDGTDRTGRMDVGRHYSSFSDLKRHIEAVLGEEVHMAEVH